MPLRSVRVGSDPFWTCGSRIVSVPCPACGFATEVRMPGCLDGRVALVTGSTNNIGRAIATAFAGEGARVVVTGRDQTRGAEVAGAIGDAGGQATFVAVDLHGVGGRSGGVGGG